MKDDKNKDGRYICRAFIAPSESDDYDFEAVAVPTNNGQMNYSYKNDEYFNQVLRTAPENVDTARLESGLPIFDNHPWDSSALNVLGITTGYSFDERGIVVRVKWGARADEQLKADVKNGVIKTVSIDGIIERYIREEGATMNDIPIYYADYWIPLSLSLAPVPNDIEAQIEIKRAADEARAKRNQPEVITTNYKKLTSKF